MNSVAALSVIMSRGFKKEEKLIMAENNQLAEEVELDMSGEPYSIKNEVAEYLESWDCPLTKDNISRVLSEWINNLRSSIGEEAHRRLALYVDDLTGMTWEEQDERSLKKIRQCEDYLKEIGGRFYEKEEY